MKIGCFKENNIFESKQFILNENEICNMKIRFLNETKVLE